MNAQMQNNGKIVLRFIEEVLNQGNIDSTGQFFWDDMVEQVPFPGHGPGLEGLKDVLRAMWIGFPDMHWSVEEQIAAGDKVLTRIIMDTLGLMMQLGVFPPPKA